MHLQCKNNWLYTSSFQISNQGTCIGGAEGNIDYLSSVNVLHCVIIPNLPVGLGNWLALFFIITLHTKFRI